MKEKKKKTNGKEGKVKKKKTEPNQIKHHPIIQSPSPKRIDESINQSSEA